MKHEITTLQTKKMLSASLKKCMEKKSLSKVTVSEIIADCGVNRKTFYYHFENIYALLKWTLEAEAIDIVKQMDLVINTEEAISFVMDYVEENKHLINCAFDAMSRDEMKHFFRSDFIDVIRKAIEAGEQDLGVSIDEDFKQYLADFISGALASMIIEWVKNPEMYEKERVLEYITLICRTSIPCVLKAKAEAEKAEAKCKI